MLDFYVKTRIGFSLRDKRLFKKVLSKHDVVWLLSKKLSESVSLHMPIGYLGKQCGLDKLSLDNHLVMLKQENSRNLQQNYRDTSA